MRKYIIISLLLICACFPEPRRFIPLVFSGNGLFSQGKVYSTFEVMEGENALEIYGRGDASSAFFGDRIYLFIEVKNVKNESTYCDFSLNNILIESNYFIVDEMKMDSINKNCCSIDLIHHFSTIKTKTPDEILNDYHLSYLRLTITDIFEEPCIVDIRFDEKGYRWSKGLHR
jgi:hypothetical protein